MNSLANPDNSTAEITILGTGGGYGESCVIHLGGQNWVVVDSCINPYTKECLPLSYFKNNGINYKECVKLIICTHWHDDHILGLSELLEECEHSGFIISRTADRKKFLQMVRLDYRKLQKETTNSSTVEFSKCLNILRRRAVPLRDASKDSILYTYKSDSFLSQIISLSPSEYSVELYNNEISSLITDFGPANTKIVQIDPNSRCIVLFIKLGPHRVLLGADLESIDDNRLGWSNILEFNNSIDKKSSLFKISHHGSINSHNENIWTDLLEPNPLATLTPYNRGTKLPTNEMVKKFLSQSSKVYITSDPNVSDKPKKRDRDFEKLLLNFNQKVSEVRYRNGIIRCQIDMTNENEDWLIDLFDNAYKLSKS
jgi:beta-lactamase superfamily II metal-dependent hydrolase